MPVYYGGILDEVRAVRSGVGVFDVSHMGEFRLRGEGALAALQFLFTNDASRLRPGRAQYTLMCRDDGGVLDDLIVYRNNDDFLVVANASNRANDFTWVTAHTDDQAARWTDESDATALLAVQGPRAAALLAPLVSGVVLEALRSFSHGAVRIRTAGGDIEARLARTGYTGEDGFEVFCAWEDAAAVWESVVAAGAAPCGLGARDVLRIEASYPLYGHEITENTNPYAAGLGWVVKPEKGPFVGRDAMVSARDAGLPLQLRGLLPEDARAIPREDAEVIHALGVGRVTSGTYSPTLQRAIAMAYLPAGATGEARVLMRGRQLPAAIVDLPFYKRPAAPAG
jgi:aminomethyltransferase